MLDCMIDGQKYDLGLAGTERAGAVIDLVNRGLKDSRRFVSSFRLDGEEISPELDGELLLDGVSMVEITTETPTQLAAKLLNESEPFIRGLQQSLTTTAQSQILSREQANRTLVESLDQLSCFVDITSFIVATLQIDLDATMVEGCSVSSRIATLNGIFTEICQAQERNDRVLVSDIIEYDLIPHLDKWLAIFATIQKYGSAQLCQG
jgi:hypothetical protein